MAMRFAEILNRAQKERKQWTEVAEVLEALPLVETGIAERRQMLANLQADVEAQQAQLADLRATYSREAEALATRQREAEAAMAAKVKARDEALAVARAKGDAELRDALAELTRQRHHAEQVAGAAVAKARMDAAAAEDAAAAIIERAAKAKDEVAALERLRDAPRDGLRQAATGG